MREDIFFFPFLARLPIDETVTKVFGLF